MFSKLMKKTIAVAAAVAMTSVMAASTSPWWSIDFDSYAEGRVADVTTEDQGYWTQNADDLSVINKDKMLVLDTQGEDLTWTPTPKAENYDSVILDADVKFVASDVEPTTTGDMQTAIYLKALEDGSTELCAYQTVDGVQVWDALEGFEIADGATKHVNITINYNDESNKPIVTVTIDGISAEPYVAANTEKKVVTSVSFRGTGTIDNFKADTGVDVTYVASVGDQQFETYAAAFEYVAANGGDLKLTGDSDETLSFGELTFNIDATIDLNGKTIEASFVVDNGAQLIIDNGTVNAPMGYDVVYIKDGKATVGADAVLNASDNCVVFMKNTADADAELALDVYGKLYATEAGFAAIQGNGLNKAASEIYIADNAVVSHEADLAIYHPQVGTLTIDAATITGTTGIEMRAGELIVNGATITATGDFDATANNNGSTVLGAAIALSQHTTEKPTTVTVNGGTLAGEYAFYQTNLADGTSESVAATIAADTIIAEGSKVATAEKGFVMPEAADGSYKLATADFIVAGMPYKTFADAYAAAAEGETIEVYTDFSATEIITIEKSVTIDGNGHTLTSTAPRAINIDTTGTVVIKDLTINAAERAINIINKPATVTLTDVTATANNNAVMIATSAGAAKVTVDNCDFTGLAVINVAGAGAQVTVADTKLTNVDANPNENYGAITVSATAEGATVAVTNSEIVVADDSKKAYVFPADATVTGVDEVGYIVATIGDAGYDTLEEAIEDAKAGQTIVLKRDITSSSIITISKDITLDLKGKTIEAAFVVDNGADLTINNGTVNAIADNDAIYIINGKATIGADATIYASDYCAVFMKNLDNADAQLALDVYGTLVGAAGYGTIQGNGKNKPASVINIYDGAKVTNAADLAIYHPQNGTLTVGKATITGTTGIEMRAGNLVVNGATITATGTYSAEANGNGSTVLGAAIALSQHDTSLPTSVTVKSGTLTGDVAFYAAGDAEDIAATIGADVVLADGADIVVAEGFEMPKADDGSYTLGVAKVEFAPVAVTAIAINDDTAELTIAGEYTEVKVFFCENLGDEWVEVSADFDGSVATVPATTATGFFKVEAR